MLCLQASMTLTMFLAVFTCAGVQVVCRGCMYGLASRKSRCQAAHVSAGKAAHAEARQGSVCEAEARQKAGHLLLQEPLELDLPCL